MMKTKVTTPGTGYRDGDERTFEVGKVYKTFTTDTRNEYNWLFKVDSIGENDRIYYTTIRGKQKSSSGTKRTQFTNNSSELDSRMRRDVIMSFFKRAPAYWYR